MAWGRKSDDPEVIVAQFVKKATRILEARDWESAAEFLGKVSAEDGAGRDRAVQIFQQLEEISTLRRYFVLNGLGADALAETAKNGAISWRMALEVKAALGTAAEVDALLLAGGDKIKQQDLDAALRAACTPRHEFRSRSDYSDDYRHYNAGNKPENAVVLLHAGASPNGDNSDLLVRAAEQNHAAIVKALVEAGANLALSGKLAMKKAEEKNLSGIALYLREKLMVLERFSMPDAETLVETKRLDDEGSQLRLVFNFSARQVTEIYNGPDDRQQAAMLSHAFADYDQQALSEAFNRLRSMGGTPRALFDKQPHGAVMPAPKPPSQ